MNKIQVGVVGDDITGCNDIAVMFVNGGLSAHVFSHNAAEEAVESQADVLVLDTDSRFIEAKEAYNRVFSATWQLSRMGAKHFFKKTCSVFRGNIGAEFDAMLDALKEDFALVVVGFPDNGRQTVNGIHHVHGVCLEESEFQNDPMNPMKESDLTEILRKQTKRNVGLIPWQTVAQGESILREEIRKRAKESGYLIVDVRNNDDLKVISAAARDVKIVCGASAIAKYQAEWLKSGGGEHTRLPVKKPGLGIMAVSASLMPQTKSQILYALEHEVIGYPVSIERLLEDRLAVKKELTDGAVGSLNEDKDVLIYSDNDKEIVEAAKRKADQMGIGRHELAKLISETLAEICCDVRSVTGENRFLIAGGDTSGSFCSKMGIFGMKILKELEPGLPSSISLPDNEMVLVLKSGSFGSEEFFVKAYDHLRHVEL